MVKIYQIDLTKENLANMPPADRHLLLLLGHATNEINILQKLILMTGQEVPELEMIDHAQSGQALVLWRILIGKLFEARELFVQRFQKDRIIREKYLPRLSAEAIVARDALDKHFGKKSPLNAIRNQFSFHYHDKDDLIEKAFHEVPSTEPWRVYLSDWIANSYFYVSELVVIAGVIELVGHRSDADESYHERSDRNFQELTQISVGIASQIMTLFGDCISVILNEHMPINLGVPAEIEAPLLDNVEIPFFIDGPKAVRRTK